MLLVILFSDITQRIQPRQGKDHRTQYKVQTPKAFGIWKLWCRLADQVDKAGKGAAILLLNIAAQMSLCLGVGQTQQLHEDLEAMLLAGHFEYRARHGLQQHLKRNHTVGMLPLKLIQRMVKADRERVEVTC